MSIKHYDSVSVLLPQLSGMQIASLLRSVTFSKNKSIEHEMYFHFLSKFYLKNFIILKADIIVN